MTKATRRAARANQVQDNPAPVQQDDISAFQTNDQVGEVITAAPIAEPTKRRRQAQPARPLDLDPEFVERPQRMQYALLLALLLRQRGTAKFSARDMAHEDTDYNIVFARTLDGQYLEVTVVSSESGIIRSPEREKETKWQGTDQDERRTSTYVPPPDAETAGQPEDPRAIFSRLHGTDPRQALTVFQPAAPATPQGTVVQFPTDPAPTPPGQEIKPADGSAPYQFPFQTGDRPETAGELNLSELSTRLMQKDQEVQSAEAAAIEKMEREGTFPGL